MFGPDESHNESSSLSHTEDPGEGLECSDRRLGALTQPRLQITGLLLEEGCSLGNDCLNLCVLWRGPGLFQGPLPTVRPEAPE